MDYKERIEQLQKEIDALPKGSLGHKTVNGHTYTYRRWQENKKRKEKYVPAEDVKLVQYQIEQRKALQNELSALREEVVPYGQAFDGTADTFSMHVLTGGELQQFIAGAKDYKRRSQYGDLHGFLQGDPPDKVFILYGLRRTGKTTLIRQALLEMVPEEFSKAAFIQVMASDTLAMVNRDLKELQRQGYRYVFLDEVTLLEDFIEGAALFSDIFAASGMRIVLSGTDSLGFLFAQSRQLYDRCIFCHTTFIPYREFEQVLGICGIDEYIRYGGTMSLSGSDYNRTSPFASSRSAGEYVDSSIARNIQHSLRCYQNEGHFRALQDLYEKNELTGAINRVVEDINHRFTVETLTKKFRSGDLAISARNLRSDRKNPTDILDRVDLPDITKRLVALLEIREKEEQTVNIEPVHAAEIKEYLDLLDLTVDIDIVDMADLNRKRTRTAISQPGLRYAQAEALVSSLLLDSEFAGLSLEERNAVLERIRSEIKGRMMEDIVLLETKKACPDLQVFPLQFAVGEFDMVRFDPAAGNCRIYEIKHSAQRHPDQARFLNNEAMCERTAFRFGPILEKCVLYRGEDGEENGVRYRNVEKYLKELP